MFATWQPEYASHGLATFPVRIVDRDKKPAVRNYLRIGLSASGELAQRFQDATAFGFALGKSSKITVLDVDSKDERILADAMIRHGKSPLVVRSGSGNFQVWFRHNGERRHIRPFRGVPIDILGAGYVVAPPSRGAKGSYEIIEGTLDDLDRLPTLQDFCPTPVSARTPATVPIGRRNDALFRHCMRHARSCDDFEALHDVAVTFAERFEQSPTAVLLPEEIRKVAISAWNYTQQGRNWMGAEHTDFDRSAFPPPSLLADPYLYGLLCWLRDHDDRGRLIMIADALAEILGWSLHQLREARRRAIEGRWVVLIEAPTRTRAARYVWGPSSITHGLRNLEVIRSPTPEREGGSVSSRGWITEANHGGVIDRELGA